MKILLYSRTSEEKILHQGFYYEEVSGLLNIDNELMVSVTNRVFDVLKVNYNSIICYFYSYSVLVVILARFKSKVVVVTGGAEQLRRDMAPSLFGYITRICAFWACLLFANKILATSTSDFKRMRQLAFFKRSTIELSFHGARAVDLMDLADFARKRPQGSMITICSMDSLWNMRRKGLFRAIDLLVQTRKVEPRAQLTVLGRTRYADIAKDYAARCGCAEFVHFLGYVPEEEKFQRLRAAKYYIQLSEYEGFGFGALEAMAMGCQVVHSNAGGLRDTVAHYGIVRSITDESELDLMAPYDIGNREEFRAHMMQFTPERRARTIVRLMTR